ncbi:MAG: sugar transferase [Bacteroidales bacterium]|nr:sugar transferase [Bacteroidales bacterium]
MHLIKPENEEVPRPYKTPLVKRIFDVFVSICALIVLSPVMLITALIIRVESRGPVIYKSKRIGSNYKTFDFYKFRSMYRDADKRLKEVIHLNQYASGSGMELICSKCAALPDGELCSPAYYYDGERICEYLAIKRQKAQKAFLKIQNDPRVTRVGKFIRNTSIDELPQLFNVLKGDMSIVGNRPLPVYEAHAITKSRWSRRFHTAAGLTGLWQVELRGRGGFMSEEERFILDNIYARKNSFLGDIVLLARTVPAIFQKTNV